MNRISVLCILLATACRSTATTPAGPGHFAITDTLTQPSDGLLGSPTGIAVSPNGQLYVVDGENAQVVVFDTGRRVLHRFGGRGSGPGELLRPRSISLSADSVWVTDAGRDQIELYTADGTFVRSLKELPWLAIAEIAFNTHGEGLLAQHGRDTALARRVTPGGRIGAKLGKPLALPDFTFDFTKGKQALANGTIPEALRSYSGPAIGDDGSAWVLWVVEGGIEHYSPTDSLLWKAALPDTILTRLRADMQARTKRDTLPYGFVFPNAIVAALPRADTLWLLLQSADGVTTIGRLDGSGTWLPWLQVHGTGQITAFAVDAPRGDIYLLDRNEGTIVRSTALSTSP